MCISPPLVNGQLISCRQCWQCKLAKKDNWVGRILAESETAKFSYFLTLTYGPDKTGESDHMSALVLTYSDVQKFFKRMRKNQAIRYFVVGEYGSQKQRAHWHIALFSENDLDIPVGERFHLPEWSHGFAHCEPLTNDSARYLVKYLVKDVGAGSEARFSASASPPLGTAYYLDLAERHVDCGLTPQSSFYQLDVGTRRHGNKKVLFQMSATSQINFVNHFLKVWAERKVGHPAYSEFIEKIQDKQLPEEGPTQQFSEPKPYDHSKTPVFLNPAEWSQGRNEYVAIEPKTMAMWSYCYCPITKETKWQSPDQVRDAHRVAVAETDALPALEALIAYKQNLEAASILDPVDQEPWIQYFKKLLNSNVAQTFAQQTIEDLTMKGQLP